MKNFKGPSLRLRNPGSALSGDDGTIFEMFQAAKRKRPALKPKGGKFLGVSSPLRKVESEDREDPQ